MKTFIKGLKDKIIDIDVSCYTLNDMVNDNFLLLTNLINNGKTENINGLLYSLCTSESCHENMFKLMGLNLTKEQRIFCLYQYMLLNYVNLSKLGENNKLQIDEVLTVIYLLSKKNYELRKIIMLWVYLLLYTNFKADKDFFTYLLDVFFEYLSPGMVHDFVNVQLQKGNKDIYYFCKEYYKENPSAFLYFPVGIQEIKDLVYKDLEENISLYHLGIICDVNIDNDFRLKLLNIYESYINNINLSTTLTISLRKCFLHLKERDKSKEVEAAFINIWGKFLLLENSNINITYPEESSICYKENIDKLNSFKLMLDLNES